MNVADTAGKVIAAKRSKSDNVNALNEALKADIKQLHEALNEEPKKSSADDKKRRKKVRSMFTRERERECVCVYECVCVCVCKRRGER